MKNIVIKGSLVRVNDDAKGRVAPELASYSWVNLGCLSGYGLTEMEFKMLNYMRMNMIFNELWFYFDTVGMKKFAELYEMKHLSNVYKLRDGLIEKGILIKGERNNYVMSRYKYAIDPHAILYCSVQKTVKMKEKWNMAWADLNKNDTK